MNKNGGLNNVDFTCASMLVLISSFGRIIYFLIIYKNETSELHIEFFHHFVS